MVLEKDDPADSKVTHLLLNLDHNCEGARLQRLLPVHLYPAIWHQALVDVRAGIKFPVIRERTRKGSNKDHRYMSASTI